MIKTILFDMDGMVVHRKVRFSQHFSNELNIPIEKINQFFDNEFKQCLVGKADLKEEIKKYFDAWNWNKSADELLQFWFECENTVSNEMIESIKRLRIAGIKCFLCTNNEKYRVEYLLDNVGLRQYFDGVFFSGEIGHVKQEKEFWQIIYNRLDKPNKESVLFWDDEVRKLVTAKEFGFLTELYTDFKKYENKINNYLNKR